MREKQLGLKESKRPSGDDNKGFKGSNGKGSPKYRESDWQGTMKGKTKHTYKCGE